MPRLSADGPVWFLDLGADENRFSPGWIDELHTALEKLAASHEPAALVTIGRGKFYSNGLDLDWAGANPDQLEAYFDRIHALLARLLTSPVPTVAAVNGHAFGAGAMLALAHDYRLMRRDRGYFCLPEVDLRLPFTNGMAAVIMAKLSPRAALDAMTTGRRYDGPAAQDVGIVDGTAEADVLSAAAADLARPLAGKDRRTLAAIKRSMFADALRALGDPEDPEGHGGGPDATLSAV